MKILMYTDKTDQDGYGCAVIAKLLFKANTDIVFTYYYDIDKQLKELIDTEKINDYDYIFITDLSMNEETAEYIDKNGEDKFLLLDHHTTALPLAEKYDWCHVSDEEFPNYTCGTLMFANYMKDKILEKENVNCIEDSVIMYYAKLVNAYDTWLWVKYYKKQGLGYNAFKLNRFFKVAGKDKYLQSVVRELDDSIEYTTYSRNTMQLGYIINEDNYDMAVDLSIDKLFSTSKAIGKNMIRKEHDGLLYGYTFLDSDISDTSEYVLCDNPEIDVMCYIIMQYNTLSFRTNRACVDVSLLAKKYGGGGHKEAAACKLTKNKMLELLEYVWTINTEKGKDEELPPINLNTVYRHFEGDYYYTTNLSLDEEGIMRVEYEPLYDNYERPTYNQPCDRFMDKINPNDIVNVTGQDRRFVECVVDSKGIHVKCQE